MRFVELFCVISSKKVFGQITTTSTTKFVSDTWFHRARDLNIQHSSTITQENECLPLDQSTIVLDLRGQACRIRANVRLFYFTFLFCCGRESFSMLCLACFRESWCHMFLSGNGKLRRHSSLSSVLVCASSSPEKEYVCLCTLRTGIDNLFHSTQAKKSYF